MSIKRKLGIVLGLTLGWGAAGLFSPLTTLAVQNEPAAPQDTHSTAAAEQPGESHEEMTSGRHAEGGKEAAETAEHGEHEEHAADKAAQALTPDTEPGWFSAVSLGIIVLFVLAALVGSAAILIKTAQPSSDVTGQTHH